MTLAVRAYPTFLNSYPISAVLRKGIRLKCVHVESLTRSVPELFCK